MPVLNVLTFPDERLRTKAQPVTNIDDSIRALVADMFATMQAESGVGLAATQVDVHQQVIVMDVSDKQDAPMVFINPQIVEQRGTKINEEGCLSVPNNYAKVERAEWVKVTAHNEHGTEFTLEAEGLLAVCIQHEMDHLQGKLFVDYLSGLKRQRIMKKLEKEARLATKA
ncbi:MAG: peptide deformylase [Glaciecola sp.]|mgnify:FL=1|jgi:peptide deformylase|nr:peptide deformylase [Glaciecola sp.]MDG1469321.1 peptide deformylase [Glaciecola sp.]MDG1921744.1 peptide deformylase [Glaciecola sp.]